MHTSKLEGRVWSAAVALAVAAAGSARAQTAPVSEAEPPAPACDWGHHRQIAGHTFLDAMLIPSALVTSHVGIRAGVDLREVPELRLPGLGQVDIEQVHFDERVDLGLRLFDRLGLFASLRGSAAASTKVRSLVVRSGEYLVGSDIGAILMLFRLPAVSTQVSVRGHVGGGTGKLLTLLPLLEALDADPRRTARDVVEGGLGELLLTPVSIRRWGAHLVAAQPIATLFSLQAMAGASVEDTTLKAFQLGTLGRRDIEISIVRPELGLAATADLVRLRIPFAVMVEYRLALLDEDNETFGTDTNRTEHLAAFGVYYTGRTDLQLGLVGFREWGSRSTSLRDPMGQVNGESDPRRLGGALVLLYFW